jgi:predicted AlkP superfamily phosphohydrolase/phosphomutase
MKILVIGLDSATPDVLLGDDRLATIRSLMEIGCHGRLESVVPAAGLPGWLGLASGKDPGALGVYGDRDRVDRSYKSPEIVDPRSIAAPTVWDQVVLAGGKSILVGGAFDRAPETDDVVETSRRRFAEVRRRLENEPWDYFQFIETGLDRIQRASWRRNADAIRDYYLHLDQELASLLDLLAEETVVLVASTRGAQRLEGGFRINEWLIREGLLTLRSYPDQPTPMAGLDVDWSQTKVWSDGGDDARLYLNVKGREPEGSIDPADCPRFRDDLKARLEATTDADGKPLGTRVFKPEEIYRGLRNVAPDLIAQFGGLSWCALHDVGRQTIHAHAADAGPDECNSARHGAFVLASPGLPPLGAIDDAHLLDLAPTLLQLGGYDPLPDARGRSLVEGRSEPPPSDPLDDDELVRERLRGLGYIG